jgi:hypothetical protein
MRESNALTHLFFREMDVQQNTDHICQVAPTLWSPSWIIDFECNG